MFPVATIWYAITIWFAFGKGNTPRKFDLIVSSPSSSFVSRWEAISGVSSASKKPVIIEKIPFGASLLWAKTIPLSVSTTIPTTGIGLF
jgi:hypothetical protein